MLRQSVGILALLLLILVGIEARGSRVADLAAHIIVVVCFHLFVSRNGCSIETSCDVAHIRERFLLSKDSLVKQMVR